MAFHFSWLELIGYIGKSQYDEMWVIKYRDRQLRVIGGGEQEMTRIKFY